MALFDMANDKHRGVIVAKNTYGELFDTDSKQNRAADYWKSGFASVVLKMANGEQRRLQIQRWCIAYWN